MNILRLRKSVQALIHVLAVGTAHLVIAVQIPINNPSFENPIQSNGGFVLVATGWTINVNGTGGVWYPGGVMGTPPDGKQVGYVNSGTLSQTLAAVLQPNSTYTLSIRVGGRNDGYVPGVNYSVSLLAGTTKLVSVVPVVPPIGSWTTLTAVYNTGATVLPGNLAIEIFAAGGGSFQFDFDLVQLDSSSGAGLTVPTITGQPASLTVASGAAATFSVTATGAPTPTYQWFKNGTAIAGATSATFTINAVQPGDAGNYTALATNSVGTATSTAATLGVNYARLVNLSVRSAAGSGSQTLIVGFAISGTGSKQMLIRGIGPTLATFGVSGVLSDPQLRLFNSANVETNQNDNWGGGAVLTAAFSSVGAFGLPANSQDAALLVPLSAGTYSAQVTSTAGTGVALVEGYDSDSIASTTRLTNLSVRSVAGTDANTLIVGFAIVGNVSKILLIRGIGPTLTGFGVTGVLADPQLQLFNASSTAITQNDNWGGSASLASTFTSVGAFGLPANSLDAALVVTLPPGVYTAQLRGAGTSTGVALVEVYDVP